VNDDARRPIASVWTRVKDAIDDLAATGEWAGHQRPEYSSPYSEKLAVNFLGVEVQLYFRTGKSYRSIGGSWSRRRAFNESKAGAKAILSDYDTDFDYPAIAASVLARAKAATESKRREQLQEAAEKRISRAVREIAGTNPSYSGTRRLDVAGCIPVEISLHTYNGNDHFALEGISEDELRACVALIRTRRGVAA
jgi:hypothetical protein